MIQETASPQSEIQRQDAPIIYLVDDDPSFLRALSRRLRAADYRVETFGSAEEFLTRRRSDAAGCAVLDLQMPGPGGLELQEALVQADEPLPVVFLTAHGDISSSVHAMKRGAVDFLTKPVRGQELLDAVQRALARGATERETQRQKREWGGRYESLTPREREVFALVVRGLLNKQISDAIGTSERTVKAHRGQVMHKMGVQSPAELGRAVEWLGEIFEGRIFGRHGERRENTRLKKSEGWALRLPEAPKFAQRYNTK
jgi:FixJ family two-component response regulator